MIKNLMALSLIFAGILLPQPEKILQLVEVENKFAKTSLEKGFVKAFYEYFAEEGIAFQQGPVNIREKYAPLLEQFDPKSITLNWRPAFAEVSYKGDIGFTYGPWIMVYPPEKELPDAYGYFFTIWKKQKDNTYKVIYDIGTRTNEYYPADKIEYNEDFVSLPRGLHGDIYNKTPDENFVSEFNQSDKKSDIYMKYLYSDCRLLRNGKKAVIGIENAMELIKTDFESLTLKKVTSGLSEYGDFLYTYGEYYSATTEEKGYYFQIWRVHPRKGWNIVFELMRPAEY